MSFFSGRERPWGFARLILRVTDGLYIGPFRKLMPLQTFRYAVCGGVNMVLGWFLYDWIYNHVFRGEFLDLGFVVISPHISTLICVFPLTFFLGFYLNRNVTFRQSPLRTRVQLVRYVLSVGGSLVLNYAFLKVFVEALGFYPTLGQVVATLFVTVYSYLMQKYFTFRGCGPAEIYP